MAELADARDFGCVTTVRKFGGAMRMKYNTVFIAAISPMLFLSACGASENSHQVTNSETEAIIVSQSTTTLPGIPLQEEEQLQNEMQQNFKGTVRDFQKNNAFTYSETIEGSILTGTYQFVTNDTTENSNLLCASIGILIFYGGINEFNEVETVELNWLDQNGQSIGRQVYERDAENTFHPVGEFVWENSNYQSVCESNLPDLNW